MNKLFLLSWCVLFFVQCTSKNKKDPSNPPNDPQDTITKYDPVELQNPNTNYQPAWKGQTRTFGIKTASPIDFSIITNSLNKPWSVNLLNEQELIISEKDGSIAIVTTNGQIVQRISSGLPAIALGGQGGLLDIAIDPAFTTNNIIYFSFSYQLPDNKNTLALASATLNRQTASLDNVKILYQSVPAYTNNMHYGSRIAMDKEGYLLVSSGERSDKQTRQFAQDLQSGLGKILRLDKEGKAHPDNPYQHLGGHATFVYTYGHRNPQGLVYDNATGKLYASEHGPKGGDELNIIQSGKNYGWPIITYGLEYTGEQIGEGTTGKAGLEQPIYYWDPSISPSGMIIYRHSSMPEWEGNIFMGALSGEHIVRIRFFKDAIAGEERLLAAENQRFRDLVQHSDGSLYAVTDAGRLYKIFKK